MSFLQDDNCLRCLTGGIERNAVNITVARCLRLQFVRLP